MASLGFWVELHPQTANDSYVLSKTPISETDTLVQIDYYDGIGQPFETVMSAATPEGQDIVVGRMFNALGQEVSVYNDTPMPHQAPSHDQSDVILASQNFYSDNMPHRQTIYDNSPLSIPVWSYGAGSEWRVSDHGKYFERTTNSSFNPCCKYLLRNSTTFYCSGLYQQGDLLVTKTIDEDGHVVCDFKDREGKIILHREVDDGVNYNTYYIYDARGNLCFVLPPLASDQLTATGTNWNADNNNVVRKYVYCYEYDNHDNCIKKKLPGCEPIYMIYDKANRMVFSQDGNQRDKNQWLFHLYDRYGRLTVSGLHNATTVTLNSNMTVETSTTVTSNGSYGGYTANLTVDSDKLLEVNYYNNYSFLNLLSSTVEQALSYEITEYGQQNASGHSSVVGLLTGKRTYILDDTANTNYSVCVYYYDYRGRIIQKRCTNHKGGYDKEFVSYTRSDKVAARKETHSTDAVAELGTVEEYSYDHADRLTSVTHQYKNKNTVTLAAYEYDEVGRLKKKTLGNGEAISYQYNLRTWPTRISSSHFYENLYYEQGLYGVSTPCWNGNLSAMSCNAGSTSDLFFYTYDGLNRLTNADYDVDGDNDGLYSTEYWYDKNGNITYILRNDIYNQTIQAIDDITMTYNGNQLQNLTNYGSSLAISGMHVKDYTGQDAEYAYDNNGNMTKDLNKNILSIQYNYLNLPAEIIFSGGNMIKYTYNADGTKLKVRYCTVTAYTVQPSPNVMETVVGSDSHIYRIDQTYDYCGSFIYRNNVINRVNTQEGYINLPNLNVQNPFYCYYLKDHLGNVRVVLNKNGSVVETNRYYPFGSQYAMGTAYQNYRYNGKELDRMHGLDWLDYNARMFDSGRCQWVQVDPLCEYYYNVSPYAYCNNNPVKYIDINGLRPGDFFWTMDEAAIDFGLFFNDNSIRQNIEYSSSILKVKNSRGELGFTYSFPNTGNKDTSEHSIEYGPVEHVGYVHTHAAYDKDFHNNEFSGIRKEQKKHEGELYSTSEQRKKVLRFKTDIGVSNRENLVGYVATPNGMMQKYSPDTGGITTISYDMPSDYRDPSRFNNVSTEETQPYIVKDILEMKSNVFKLIQNAYR